MTNEEGGIDPEEARYEMLVDRVNTTATAWLGTTLGCAQCHNHKYDPFTQKDYYRMMAFFQNSAFDAKTFGDGTRYFEATIDVPTPEQEARRKAIQAEIDAQQLKMKADTPALAHAQALWEQATRAEASTSWHALTPSRTGADGGVALTAGPDGSVVASVSNPGETVYTIDAKPLLAAITALRLEALPDPLLPKGGPGRDPYGNFQITGIEIEAGGSRATIKAIRADEAVGGTNFDAFFPKTLPRGATAPRGWRIDASREEKRVPRQIVFTLDQRVEAAPALTIRVTHQGAAVGQSLGRFRLSVTASTAPQRIVEIPAKLRPVLNMPATERTEQQRKDLASFYRTVAVS